MGRKQEEIQRNVEICKDGRTQTRVWGREDRRWHMDVLVRRDGAEIDKWIFSSGGIEDRRDNQMQEAHNYWLKRLQVVTERGKKKPGNTCNLSGTR